MLYRLIPALTGIALISLAPQAQATSITFTDFSSLTGLQMNGVADDIHTCDAGGNTGCDQVTDSLGRKVLRLTNNFGQSASVFSQSTIALNNAASFSSAFQFRISDIAGGNGICDEDGCGADGIVFTVQTVSNAAGGSGGGIGYNGLARSVGIEIDTWNNGGWDDNNGNHIGINTNGNIDSIVQRNVPIANPGTGDPFGRMNNGNDWYAWVDYNGSSNLLEVRLSNNSARPSVAYLSTTVDLLAVLDPTNTGIVNAFAGFTSGTGSARNYHDIVAWQFNDDYQPIVEIGEVPVPGALELLTLALIGFGVVRRRYA